MKARLLLLLLRSYYNISKTNKRGHKLRKQFIFSFQCFSYEGSSVILADSKTIILLIKEECFYMHTKNSGHLNIFLKAPKSSKLIVHIYGPMWISIFPLIMKQISLHLSLSATSEHGPSETGVSNLVYERITAVTACRIHSIFKLKCNVH